MEDTTNPFSFLSPLKIKFSTLTRLAISFSTVYTNLALTSPTQFLATPVTTLPNGTEKGQFLAIDVGGSNLRVGFVQLLGSEHGKGKERIKRTYEKSWSIEEHLKLDNAEELFAWIGACIAEVIGERVFELGSTQGKAEEVVPVGITFSFPMIQSSIASATLMPMGKGFAISSNLSLDLLLLAGYARQVDVSSRKLPKIHIAAIANDTVATLASAAYIMSSPSSNTHVAMSLIVATGSNATTTLPITSLSPSKTVGLVFLPNTDTPCHIQRVVVNTEWGINGTLAPLHAHSLVTKWDAHLDRETSAPGFQPFEYMTAGRYVGELCRLILLDYLSSACGIPLNQLPPRLQERNALTTIFLSDIVARTHDPAILVSKLHVVFPPPGGSHWTWTLSTAQVVLEIERNVMQRSVVLNAAAVIGLLACAGEIDLDGGEAHVPVTTSGDDKRERKVVIVAYAGGVICQYPGYLERCQEVIDAIVEVVACGWKVVLEEAADGGLIGAAVLAATVWGTERRD